MTTVVDLLGDGDAFVAWARDRAPDVHRFLRRRTGSTTVADRLLSATFERAVRELPSRSPEAPADSAWLVGLAADEVEGETAAGDPVLEALGSLRRRPRRTLGLVAFGGLPTEDVARVTGRSPATVAVAVDRAVDDLARCTGQEPPAVRAALDRLATTPVDPVTADVLDDLERRLRPFHAAQRPTAVPGRSPRHRVVALAAVAVAGLVLLGLLVVRGGPTTVEIVEIEAARVELPDGTAVEPEDGLRVPPGTVITTEENGFARFSFDEIGPGETVTVFEGRIER